jgi:hypothetical protein
MIGTEAEAEMSSAPVAFVRHALKPAFIAGLLYSALTLVLGIVAYRACDRHFVYPIDDTYIMMAMAKNLTLHGVWGVSSYGFSSSSSSILYPLILAGAFRVSGVNEFVPCVLSWLFGLGTIFVAGRMLKGFVDRRWQAVVLILVVVLTPLFVLAMIGMEHSLHLLLTLLFLEYFLRSESEERLGRLALITGLMVASRYEGLFLAITGTLLLWKQKRWRAALTTAVAAVIPVCIYGWFSVAHGGYWLPNSVALKGAGPAGGSIGGAVRDMLTHISLNYHEGFHLLLLMATEAALLVAMSKNLSHRAVAPLALVLGAGCMHFCTARVGWVFRYEDYLIGSGIVLIACVLPALQLSTLRSIRSFAIVPTLAGFGLLSVRGLIAMIMLPSYAHNVYLQQWQMAHFVASYLKSSVIAANDIGAIEYFSDVRCVDLAGLADREIFQARRNGHYTTGLLRQVAQVDGVTVAMVYDSWFTPESGKSPGPPSIPGDWVRVARWSTPEALQLGGRTVSFYSVGGETEGSLRQALDRYAPRLPAGVVVAQH